MRVHGLFESLLYAKAKTSVHSGNKSRGQRLKSEFGAV